MAVVARLLLHDTMMKPGREDGSDRRFGIAGVEEVKSFPLRPTKFLLGLEKELSLQDGGLVSAPLKEVIHDEVNGTHTFDFSCSTIVSLCVFRD